MTRGNYLISRIEDQRMFLRQDKPELALDHLKGQLEINLRVRDRLKKDLQESEDIIRETKILIKETEELMKELVEGRG